MLLVSFECTHIEYVLHIKPLEEREKCWKIKHRKLFTDLRYTSYHVHVLNKSAWPSGTIVSIMKAVVKNVWNVFNEKKKLKQQ